MLTLTLLRAVTHLATPRAPHRGTLLAAICTTPQKHGRRCGCRGWHSWRSVKRRERRPIEEGVRRLTLPSCIDWRHALDERGWQVHALAATAKGWVCGRALPRVHAVRYMGIGLASTLNGDGKKTPPHELPKVGLRSIRVRIWNLPVKI